MTCRWISMLQLRPTSCADKSLSFRSLSSNSDSTSKMIYLLYKPKYFCMPFGHGDIAWLHYLLGCNLSAAPPVWAWPAQLWPDLPSCDTCQAWAWNVWAWNIFVCLFCQEISKANWNSIAPKSKKIYKKMCWVNYLIVTKLTTKEAQFVWG